MALHETFSLGVDPELGLQAEIAALNAQFEDAVAQDILQASIRHQFAGEIAMVSSFGADSAVLLHMVSQVDPSTPVLFVDTVKLFPATILYRDELIAKLGLTDVRTFKPSKDDLAEKDPAGMLWMSDTDACCHIRKVVPLERALHGFEAWISGRKRHQSSTRSELDFFEIDAGRVKINPLLILLSVKGVAPVKRSTRRERRAEAAVAGSAADLTSGLRVIQGLSASRRATVRFRVVSREGLAATLRTRRVRGVYTGTVNASVGVFITVLTVLAGWLTLDGRISVGSLVTVVGLAQTLGPPLRALGVDTATMLANAHASGDRFCELHDSPAAWQVPPDDSERPAPAGRPDGSSRINSSESPNGCPDANPTGNPTHSDSPPLHTPVHLHVQVEDPSLQLDVPPGAHLGIVAPQQVCDALAQTIVHGSHTLLNGVPASQLGPARKRALVLVAPRSPELFDDTVQANIMLGSTRDDMLDAVVRAAALDTTIAELPHGLQTGVGEGGRHVSGGQRQRLALARALIHAPDGLVLIDPTTSIDAATTAAIAERMGELRAGRTTLIATTSPALLDRMDEVVLFDDDGHLVARAPHRELLGHDGYREMLS